MRERLPRLAIVALLAALLYAFIVCAWQCDDAYITFRTVRNAWSGLGLGFNPHERVQAYTHPLWMIVVALVFGVTREVFVSVTVVSVAFGLCAAALLASIPRERPWRAVALLAVLLASRAFLEFAVCGLENPLLFTLLAALPYAARTRDSSRRDRVVTLALSLAYLTRPDAVLLVTPLWIALVATRRPSAASVALGFAPAVAWELFSLVYYGALFPNSALAKLNLHVPRGQLVSHGVAYLADSLRRDPITLVATALALAYVFARGDRMARAMALGVITDLAFVVIIGGDFMSGRFLGAPMVLALAAASTIDAATGARAAGLEIAAAAAAFVSMGVVAQSPIRSTLAFGRLATHAEILGATGIADERAYYYPLTGFVPVLLDRPVLEASGLPIPPYPGAVRGLNFARTNERAVVYNEIGFFGWFAGDKIVVDRWALADPLLARIPFRAAGFARVGHFARTLPRGYEESLRTGTNRLEDPALHAAYDDIRLVTSAPVASSSRWRAIVALGTGRHRTAFERAR